MLPELAPDLSVLFDSFFAKSEENKEDQTWSRHGPPEEQQNSSEPRRSLGQKVLVDTRKVAVDVSPVCPWPQTGRGIDPKVVGGEGGTPGHLCHGHGYEAQVSIWSQSRIGVVEMRGECQSAADEVEEGQCREDESDDRKEERGEPNEQDSWHRYVDCSLAAQVLKDVVPMALNNVI